MDVRLRALGAWVAASIVKSDEPLHPSTFAPVSDDASFRRYFRCTAVSKPMVFMDAPPDKEPLGQFLSVTEQLRNAAQPVPEIFAFDETLGFLALSDFGDEKLFDVLSVGSAKPQDLLPHLLLQLNALARVESELPDYSKAMLTAELELFPEWYLQRLLNIQLDDSFWSVWRPLCAFLIESAVRQPQVFVHRDFHSRNIMMRPRAGLGLLDYQDAVVGPLTYDLVSLLKDCYWRFDRELVVSQVAAYFDVWRAHPNLRGMDRSGFLSAFDLMGLQRHLKCAGIFARLSLRDGKARYLDDIPLVMDYIFEVCSEQDECSEFFQWLKEYVEPLIKAAPG